MNTQQNNLVQQEQSQTITAEQLKSQKAHLGHEGGEQNLSMGQLGQVQHGQSQTITAQQLEGQKAHLDHVSGVLNPGQLHDLQPAHNVTGEQLKDQKAHLGQGQGESSPTVHVHLHQQELPVPAHNVTGGQLKDQKSHLGHVEVGQVHQLDHTSPALTGGQLKDQKSNLDHVEVGQTHPSPAHNVTGEQLKDQKSHLGHVDSGVSDPSVHQKEMAAVHHFRKENAPLSPQNYLPPADLSGEQVSYKIENAQDILKQLQGLMQSGGNLPAADVLDDALKKAELFLLQQSNQSQLDPQTKKTLEDLANLISSVKKLAQDKDLVERLQRIGDETAKATREINQPGVSAQTREASKRVVDIVENWRPLFQLLISTREFRMLIADSVSILRRVLFRHKSFDSKQIEQKFIEGESPVQMAQNVAKDTKESFTTPGGDLQVRISDEEFEELYQDIARVMLTLAKTPAYRSGLDKIFRLFDIWNSQLSNKAASVSQSVEPHAQKAQSETKELVATFAGREPLDNFTNSLQKLVDRVNQDAKTRQYLSELRQFVLDTKTAEKLSETETKERLKRFARDGRELVEQYKYADEINDFFDKSDALMESIKRDELLSVLREQAGLVANDLSYVDEQGVTKLDTTMLGNLRGAIAPVIAESLKYVPIPRIEDEDKSRHFWVDNIVLCGYDIIPDKIRIQMESDSTINVREIQTDESQTRLILSLNNIKTELKNLDFFYHKKSFPHFTENGKVTLSFPGDGASLVITYIIEQPSGAAVPLFRQGLVDFQIHNFQVDFDKETLRHDVLVPMFTTMFKNLIQRQIELAVERNIGGLVNSIGEKISSSLVDLNRPMMMGMDKMRNVIKTSEVGTVFDKRREILE